MYETLGADIARRLEGKGSPAAGGNTPIHQDVVKKLNGVKNFDDLLRAVAALETLVAAYIGLELTRYSWKTPIAQQPDRGKIITDYAQILFDTYRMVLSGATKSNATPDGELASDVNQVRMVDDTPAKDSKPVLACVGSVRDFILLSLWVAARSEPGQKLVAELARTKATLTLRIVYKGAATSLNAYPAGPGVYCTGTGPVDQSADAATRLATVTPGVGAGSDMGAPVWLDTEPLAPELLAATFKRQTVDEALSKILMGSISFTRDRSPFFTPARVELLHELIHVLHNAQGINREKVKGLTEQEAYAYHDAEEYWTTAGPGITENAFNETLGLPDRYGHGGLPLPDLRPTSPFAKSTFQELAGF
jgi:hypothetical protein